MPARLFWNRTKGDEAVDIWSSPPTRQPRRLTKSGGNRPSRPHSLAPRHSNSSLPYIIGGYPETTCSTTRSTFALDPTPSPERLSDSSRRFHAPSFDTSCYESFLGNYDAPPMPSREPPQRPDTIERSQSEFSLASRHFSYPLRSLRTSPSGQSLADETKRSVISLQDDTELSVGNNVSKPPSTSSRKRRSLIESASNPLRRRSLLHASISSKRQSNKLVKKQPSTSPAPAMARNEDQLYYFDSKLNQFRPVEEKPGYRTVANTYSPERAGTPCELSVESSGGLRLGALRVMNASPVPSESTVLIRDAIDYSDEPETPFSSDGPTPFSNSGELPLAPSDGQYDEPAVTVNYQTIPWEYSEPMQSSFHNRGQSHETIYYDAEEASTYDTESQFDSTSIINPESESSTQRADDLLTGQYEFQPFIMGQDYELTSSTDAAALAGSYADELAMSILESRGVTPMPQQPRSLPRVPAINSIEENRRNLRGPSNASSQRTASADPAPAPEVNHGELNNSAELKLQKSIRSLRVLVDDPSISQADTSSINTPRPVMMERHQQAFAALKSYHQALTTQTPLASLPSLPPLQPISRPCSSSPNPFSINRKPVAPDSGYNSNVSLNSLQQATGLQRDSSKGSGGSDLSSRGSRDSPQPIARPITPQLASPLSMHPVTPGSIPSARQSPSAPPAVTQLHARTKSSSSAVTTKALPQVPKDLPPVPPVASQSVVAEVNASDPPRRRRSRSLLRFRSRSRSCSSDSCAETEKPDRVSRSKQDKSKPPSASEGLMHGRRRRSRSRSTSETRPPPQMQGNHPISTGQYPPEVPQELNKRLSLRANSPLPRLTSISQDELALAAEPKQEPSSERESEMDMIPPRAPALDHPGSTSGDNDSMAPSTRSERSRVSAPHQSWSHPMMDYAPADDLPQPNSQKRKSRQRSRQGSAAQLPANGPLEIDYIDDQFFSDNPGASPYDHGMRAQRSMSAERSKRPGDRSRADEHPNSQGRTSSRHPPSSARRDSIEGPSSRSQSTYTPAADQKPPQPDLNTQVSGRINPVHSRASAQRIQSSGPVHEHIPAVLTPGKAPVSRSRPLSMFVDRYDYHAEDHSSDPIFQDTSFTPNDRRASSQLCDGPLSAPLPPTREGLARALGVSHRSSYCSSPQTEDAPQQPSIPTPPARPAPGAPTMSAPRLASSGREATHEQSRLPQLPGQRALHTPRSFSVGAQAPSREAPSIPEPIEAAGRYENGYTYGYEGRGKGVVGSAGLRGKGEAGKRRSIWSRQRWGLDFTDVPVTVGKH